MRRRYPFTVLPLVLVSACEVHRADDSTMGVARQQGAPSRSAPPVAERPMAHRLEGQALIDSAREIWAGGDPATAAVLLQRAAGFFTVQAAVPPNAGSAALLATAAALDSLAADVRVGRGVDTTRLDRLSARANLAEAARHGALAAVAWSTRSRESVGDELTMAADHVERAAVDGRIALPASTRRLLAEMRDIARQLAAHRELDVHAVDEPLASLHLEIADLQRRLGGA